MPNQLQDLSDDELVTASGGSLNGATFGALALLNASGMTTDPSSSVAKALQDPPPIVRIQPMPSAPAPSGSGSKPGS